MWSHVRFHLENFLLRGPVHQLTFLLGLVLTMALVGGALVFVLDSGNHGSHWAAIWWAFLRLTDTGYLGEDQGLFRRFVSTLLTFSGHVVFFGAVVAILTNGFAGAMRFLASGRGRVLASGHVVVAGELGQLENLVEELLYVESKTAGRRGTLLLLVPSLDPAHSARLTSSVPHALQGAARIIFRQGNLLDKEAYRTASWTSARSLIVMHSDAVHGTSRPAESAMFKMLLELAFSVSQQPNLRAPRLVVEVSDEAARKRFARLRWPAEYDIIPRQHFAGQLLAQVVANRGLSELYAQLLTDLVGDALHLLRPAPREVVGLTIREALEKVGASALPIGLLRDKAVIMAVLDEVILKEDGLVIIGDSAEIRTNEPLSDESNTSLVVAPQVLSGDVLICGTGPWWGTLVRALSGRIHPQAKLKCLMESGAPPGLPAQIQAEQVECLEDALPAYNLEGVTRIVVLGGYSSGDASDADVETIACLHALLDNPGLTRFKPRLHCELRRDDHSGLVRMLHPEIDILLTDHVLRHVVAQVAAKPALYEVYEDLLATGGSCFASLPLPATETQITYAEAQGWSLREGCIGLGFYVPNAQEGWTPGVHLRPPAQRALRLTGSEALLVLQREPHA